MYKVLSVFFLIFYSAHGCEGARQFIDKFERKRLEVKQKIEFSL